MSISASLPPWVICLPVTAAVVAGALSAPPVQTRHPAPERRVGFEEQAPAWARPARVRPRIAPRPRPLPRCWYFRRDRSALAPSGAQPSDEGALGSGYPGAGTTSDRGYPGDSGSLVALNPVLSRLYAPPAPPLPGTLAPPGPVLAGEMPPPVVIPEYGVPLSPGTGTGSTPTPVPEPASLALLGVGLAALAVARRAGR